MVKVDMTAIMIVINEMINYLEGEVRTDFIEGQLEAYRRMRNVIQDEIKRQSMLH